MITVEVKEDGKVVATMRIERSYTGMTPMNETSLYKVSVDQQNAQNGNYHTIDEQMELTRRPFPMPMIREALNRFANEA